MPSSTNTNTSATNPPIASAARRRSCSRFRRASGTACITDTPLVHRGRLSVRYLAGRQDRRQQRHHDRSRERGNHGTVREHDEELRPPCMQHAAGTPEHHNAGCESDEREDHGLANDHADNRATTPADRFEDAGTAAPIRDCGVDRQGNDERPRDERHADHQLDREPKMPAVSSRSFLANCCRVNTVKSASRRRAAVVLGDFVPTST